MEIKTATIKSGAIGSVVVAIKQILIHGPRWSHKLFFNYGVVTDTFIPNKRRKLTRSRFGFVRYNWSVVADMAVQKANGLWCGDCALRVKMEEFGKYGDAKHKMVYVPQTS
ncbi:hypothetical protein ACSBR2_013694 [Camellia fascicularis]